MNDVLLIVLPADVAELGVVIAALGVAVIFLYRSGQFYKQPDPAFAKRFPTFKVLLMVSLGCALLSAFLALAAGTLAASWPWIAALSVLLFVLSIVATAYDMWWFDGEPDT